MTQDKIAILLHDKFEMWRPPAWFIDRLRAEYPHFEVVHSSSNRTDRESLRDASVMIGWTLNPEQLREARNLKWIYSITAGVDRFLFPEFLASSVVLTNAGCVHGAVVAEHAMAMVLALAKRIPTAVRYQQNCKWAMEAIWKERPRQLAGSTLVTVGLGNIGAEVAAMAAALKMHVIGVREHPERGAGAAHQVFSYDSLDDAIRVADFVVLAAPLTACTRRLIDRHRLSLFKTDAYLINVSRGALIDEPALIDALRDHRLSGAALDVFEQEPLPSGSPLWKLRQVVITPHTAFLDARVWQRHYETFTGNLKAYVKGQPIQGTRLVA